MNEIRLPQLDGLQPTLESTALKLMEEAGELARAIGKGRAMNGEQETDPNWLSNVAEELLDVAQTTISMMFVLSEQYGMNLDEAREKHLAKLKEKGYLL
jgi:NTP pyrophosphatase (non-canonical NTP hydrolase)